MPNISRKPIDRERKEELRKARKRVLVGIIVAIVSVMLAGWAWRESVLANMAREESKKSEITAKLALSVFNETATTENYALARPDAVTI